MRTKRLGEPRIPRVRPTKPREQDAFLKYLDTYLRGELTEKQIQALKEIR